MARAPSSTLHTAFVRCVALLLLVPISGVALVPYPSNMDALVATVEDAIDESLAGLEMSSETGDAPVFIAPQGRHDANWLVEHVLAQRLLERGFTIVSDSTQVGQESMRFSFRILDMGITAQSGLRGAEADRQTRATLALRLNRESDHIVYWQDEITRLRADRIPKNQLEILQHSTYKFAQTDVEEQSWSKFVEPIVVSTVLGGLIYLFFSNR